ncbi:SAM-dependent methyltransferase [Saccharopolyspora sp. K220]|uniref:SAM-dependent methyltransferase n=1 Tax=Saccharopolyspora soli TaxID=2926618 RepID=UPI001F57DFD3|nr:SAM-dependent methyltransferase [Saccharopolyspora soli]MCI2416899.1 SAM-dependent methyltransferase [Saccharopolyspora soli]
MVDEPPANPALAEKIRSDRPHPARVWNALLGGKDNYAADREAADEIAKADPTIRRYAQQCREFLVRSVRYLAGEAGIRQFLDIGTGLPTELNTHEVAQSVAPESRVVYVDNDPLVLIHARALLTNTTPEGVTTYVDADVRDPETIIADAQNVLNFNEPIAVMLLGIFGHAAPEYATMRSILDRLMAAVPSGSYLVLLDGARTDDEVYIAAVARAAEVGHPYHLRTPEQLAECFAELEMVEPGMVPVNRWRPDPSDAGRDKPCNAYGGMGRKP